jgi:hypothetical protein
MMEEEGCHGKDMASPVLTLPDPVDPPAVFGSNTGKQMALFRPLGFPSRPSRLPPGLPQPRFRSRKQRASGRIE